jgi:FkbM family methyltransferase
MSFLMRMLRWLADNGNPGRIIAQRLWPQRFPLFEAVDRRSGIACSARPRAEGLFAEIWFHHDYDIPGVVLRPGDVVLDIGGNQGFYACYAAWQGARVHSFEPDAENAALFRQNVTRNGFADRVTLVPAAVKGYAGKTAFYTTPALGGGMQTTVAAFAESYGHQKGEEVPCINLADFINAPGFERIRVCKIDCEGAELEIMQSLTPELAAHIDGIALEFHSGAYKVSALVEVLEKLGTHHFIFAPPKAHCPRAVIWAVSRTCLQERAGQL